MLKNQQSSLVRNMLFNCIYKGVYLLFPILTIPYLSRVILPEGIGKVDFSISIVNYFLIFASLGIPQYGIREIAKSKSDLECLSKNFSEIYLINFFSTTVTVALYYLMIFSLPYFADKIALFSIMGIVLILNIFNVDWFYQGMEQYGYIAVRSIIVKIISLTLIFVFVKRPEDYIIYAALYVFGISCNNIFNMLKLRKFIILFIHGLEIRRHIKTITILLSTQLAITLYINLDITMLGIISGDKAVGIFTSASKLCKLIVLTITSVSVVLLPRISKLLTENNRAKINITISNMFDLLLFVSLPITIGIILLSEDIVLSFFGPDFFEAALTLRILASLIIILSIGNLFGMQVLMAFGKEKHMLVSVIAGFFINFILNMILIPTFSEKGAAIASLITEIGVLCIQCYMALQYIQLRISKTDLLSLFWSNLSVICILFIVTVFFPVGFVRLIISALISSVLYILLNVMFKHSLIKAIYLKIKLS